MKTKTDKPKDHGQQPVGNLPSQGRDNRAALQFIDKRAGSVTQGNLREATEHSPRHRKIAQMQTLANNVAGRMQTGDSQAKNETGLPDNLKAGIESLSGYALDDVKLHFNSTKPAQLQARAYTQGIDIYIGPGQEKHLPHEAWHVVQQKQERVRPTMRSKQGMDINDDASLEKEADIMGYKASVEQGSGVQAGKYVDASPAGGQTCIQAKLGFELEWLTFVDIKGHRIPEKTKLGSYGNHLNLDVDESNVGALEEPAPENTDSYWSDTDNKYYFYNHLTKESTWADPGGAHKPYPSIVEVVTNPYAPETQAGRVDILASMNEAVAFADAINDGTGRQPMKNVPALTPAQDHLNIGHDKWGSTDASIQTTFGVDLAQLGPLIESLSAEKSYRSQFKMKHHSDTKEGALRADDETLTAMGENTLVGLTQENMPARAEGDRVEAELTQSISSARAIVNALVDNLAGAAKISGNRKEYWKSHLHNLEGLLICMCQYLRMGAYFYFPDVIEDDLSPDLGKMKKSGTGQTIWRKNLDKNVVAMMARTDMAIIYSELVPDAEKKMDCSAAEVTAALIPLLCLHTGRGPGKALFNDPTESMGKGDTDFPWMVSCAEFVDNTFKKGSDGVTPNFGAIQTMGPEKVDSGKWQKASVPESDTDNPGETFYHHPTEASQWEKPDSFKEGAVFELRNMIPRLGGGRFPKRDWIKLAEHITKCLAMLNARDEGLQDKVNPKWASKDESWENAL